jgi:hypothetical protein
LLFTSNNISNDVRENMSRMSIFFHRLKNEPNKNHYKHVATILIVFQ